MTINMPTNDPDILLKDDVYFMIESKIPTYYNNQV